MADTAAFRKRRYRRKLASEGGVEFGIILSPDYVRKIKFLKKKHDISGGDQDFVRAMIDIVYSWSKGKR